ncbi:hypothetical protein BYT27DRAFT_7119436 [Phlegmacium glaucopus]|nr:hypothetical protein BYT27DRAFT_7119436 [Phlegmacium glaucopus]
MAAYRLQNHIRRSQVSLLQTRRNLVVSSENLQEIFKPSIDSADDSLEGPIHSTIIPHKCYILLHSSRPISEFPARWNTTIQRTLQLRASRWGGLVNFSWYGPPSVAANALDDGGEDAVQAKKQPATAFTAAGGRLEIPDITLENMDQVEQKIKDHLNGPLSKDTSDEIHLYVCTHGARDCRCGTRGSLLVNALREEKANYQRLYPESLAKRIKIGEVSHVGGHKYAANLLMFPHGEWLGLLTAEDAPRVIHEVCRQEVRPRAIERPPLMARNWRGRMGLSKAESIELWNSYIEGSRSS